MSGLKVVGGSLVATLVAWTALAQPAPFVDKANHFEVKVPVGWYPIQASLLEALSEHLHAQGGNEAVRYVGGYSTSPAGELTLPYVLIQVTDGEMNRGSENQLVREFQAEPWKEELSDALWQIELTPRWDSEEQKLIMSIRGDVPGVGPIRGISVGRVASQGLVQVNCYATAAGFDAAAPAFEQWVDGVHIDPDYRWEPRSNGAINWRRTGSMAMVGAIAGGLGSLVLAQRRRS